MIDQPVRVALVTGGIGGIGRAVADRLSLEGYQVFVTSRSAPTGPVAPGIELVRLDTGDPASIDACVAAVLERFGRIDVLVNSIGNGLIGAVEEASEAEGRQVIDDLFWSAVRLIKAVLPGMRERGAGRIVSMSSLGGRIGFPFSAFYSAGKFALEGFCEALHVEVKPFGVHVSLIEPAGVSTRVAGNVPMARNALPAYGDTRHRLAREIERMMRGGLQSERVAAVIAQALDDPSPKLRYVVGGPARMMSILLRLAPERLMIGVRRKMAGR